MDYVYGSRITSKIDERFRYGIPRHDEELDLTTSEILGMLSADSGIG